MEITQVLLNFAMISMIITIATDNNCDLLKPYVDLTKYKLTIAFLWTVFAVVSLNIGVFKSLNLIPSDAIFLVHYVDLAITISFLSKGAQSIHRLADMVTDYMSKKEK